MQISDNGLAALVTTRPPDGWADGCVAWVAVRDAQCGRPRAEGWLCRRHHTVAWRRATRALRVRQARGAAYARAYARHYR